jgi:hypothetical protein
MRTGIQLAFAGLAATLLLFGIFVWPTPYQYICLTREWSFGGAGGVRRSQAYQRLYRINRFTGAATPVATTEPDSTDEENAVE